MERGATTTHAAEGVLVLRVVRLETVEVDADSPRRLVIVVGVVVNGLVRGVKVVERVIEQETLGICHARVSVIGTVDGPRHDVPRPKAMLSQNSLPMAGHSTRRPHRFACLSVAWPT